MVDLERKLKDPNIDSLTKYTLKRKLQIEKSKLIRAKRKQEQHKRQEMSQNNLFIQ